MMRFAASWMLRTVWRALLTEGMAAAAGGIDVRQFDLADELGQEAGRFDVVMANLTGGLLIRFAEKLAQLATPDGLLLVSGFDGSEVEAVSAAFAVVGWRQNERLDEDHWTGLTLTSIPTPPTGR